MVKFIVESCMNWTKGVSWQLQCNHRFSLLFFHVSFWFFWRHPILSVVNCTPLSPSFPSKPWASTTLRPPPPFSPLFLCTVNTCRCSQNRMPAWSAIGVCLNLIPSHFKEPASPSCNSNADGFFFVFILLFFLVLTCRIGPSKGEKWMEGTLS